MMLRTRKGSMLPVVEVRECCGDRTGRKPEKHCSGYVVAMVTAASHTDSHWHFRRVRPPRGIFLFFWSERPDIQNQNSSWKAHAVIRFTPYLQTCRLVNIHFHLLVLVSLNPTLSERPTFKNDMRLGFHCSGWGVDVTGENSSFQNFNSACPTRRRPHRFLLQPKNLWLVRNFWNASGR